MTALYDREAGLLSAAGLAVLLGVEEQAVRDQIARGSDGVMEMPETWAAAGASRMAQIRAEHGVIDVLDAVDLLAQESR